MLFKSPNEVLIRSLERKITDKKNTKTMIPIIARIVARVRSFFKISFWRSISKFCGIFFFYFNTLNMINSKKTYNQVKIILLFISQKKYLFDGNFKSYKREHT